MVTELKKLKILIVGSDVAYQHIFYYVLLKEGYELLSVITMNEAIENFSSWRPHIVISELYFGSEQLGLEICMKLKNINSRVPIIIFSGDDRKEVIEKAKVLKVDEYIITPFSIPYLLRTIRNLCINLPDNLWTDVKQQNQTDYFGKQKLGSMLVNFGYITEEKLNLAIREQQRDPRKTFLGEYLLKLNLITEEQLMKALGIQKDCPYFTDFSGLIDPALVEKIPKKIAYQNYIVPLFQYEDTVYIGTCNPLNVIVLDDVRAIIKNCRQVVPIVTTKTNLMKTLKDLYGPMEVETEISELESISQVVEEIPVISETEISSLDEIVKLGDRISTEKLTNAIVFNALKSNASDIHIEPYQEQRYRVRYRIDGILTEVLTLPTVIANKIISRIKVMCKLDIAQKFIPQDGRTKLKYENKIVDFRVAVLPGLEGEKVAIRILERDMIIKEISALGFEKRELDMFTHFISKNQGFILIVGPTGSGKTTTLYSALFKIGSPEKNIITIEDPVEYFIEKFSQTQVDTKKGLTFASFLRAALRQDPDIILVGEIRDKETVDIAIHAALTGHLVFSTLHTNNSCEAIDRLRDMGVETFLLSSAISCIIAQRLVRLLCPQCKTPYKPDADFLRKLNLAELEKEITVFYKSKGCQFCRNTGYKGRIGIFEFLPMHGTIKQAIQLGKPSSEILKIAQGQGFRTLKQNCLQKILRGETSVEELLRCIPD